MKSRIARAMGVHDRGNNRNMRAESRIARAMGVHDCGSDDREERNEPRANPLEERRTMGVLCGSTTRRDDYKKKRGGADRRP